MGKYIFIYKGFDFSPVFDLEYFKKRYPQVVSAIGDNPFKLFSNFVFYGIPNGVQGSAQFNPRKYRYSEENILLNVLYDDNWEKYYLNYLEKIKLNKSR